MTVLTYFICSLDHHLHL